MGKRVLGNICLSLQKSGYNCSLDLGEREVKANSKIAMQFVQNTLKTVI